MVANTSTNPSMHVSLSTSVSTSNVHAWQLVVVVSFVRESCCRRGGGNSAMSMQMTVGCTARNLSQNIPKKIPEHTDTYLPDLPRRHTNPLEGLAVSPPVSSAHHTVFFCMYALHETEPRARKTTEWKPCISYSTVIEVGYTYKIHMPAVLCISSPLRV